MEELKTVGWILLIICALVVALMMKKPKDQKMIKSEFEGKVFKKRYVLSICENEFYGQLATFLESLPGEYRIYPQVRLSDAVGVKKGKGHGEAFNKLKAKHVDFIVTDKRGETLFGIELDDKSHEMTERKRSDEIKNAVFELTGTRLLRFKAGKIYNFEEILKEFEKDLTGGPHGSHKATP